MTIRQQGGVFGRNPTFSSVDVSNNVVVGGNANVSGVVNINNSAISAEVVIVADDGVATITPPRLGGWALLTTNADTFPNVAEMILLYYDAAASPISRKLQSTAGTVWSGTTGANVSVTTGALTGTTGTDGNVTFSAVGDNTVQLENRLGAAAQFNLTFL